MKIKGYLIALFLHTGLTFSGAPLWAQLLEVPLSKEKPKNGVPSRSNETDIFPFWDDFSSGNELISQRWEESNVRISGDFGINSPSINHVVFNGADKSGVPYSNDPTRIGPADTLTSKPIDISAFNVDDNLYLSFFWQLKGRGNTPNPEDSLVLEFRHKDADSSHGWKKVWFKNGTNDQIEEEFNQVLIPLNQEDFFHSNFQFRFRNYGHLGGELDDWLVDYIYLDKNRSPNDQTYLDRALSSRPSSIFKEFTAIPANHFFSDPESYVGPINIEFNNLDNQPQPVEIKALLIDKVTLDTLDIMTRDADGDSYVPNPPPQSLERRLIEINPINATAIPNEEDPETGSKTSVELETLVFLSKSGDTLLLDNSNGQNTYYQTVDFRSNDTIRSDFYLDDYYAYDDGTAEYAAGINQNSGMLAYQFIIKESGYIDHIDINFAQTGENYSGVPIDLMVWKSLEDESQQNAYTQSATVNYAGQDGFISYDLHRPIWVEDTFYIGYRQYLDDYLLVGLDKNTNTGEKIFFNTMGKWQSNEKVQGSLLLRPGFVSDISTITGTEPEISNEILIFPNPTEGPIHINGQFNKIKIYDMNGRFIKSIEGMGSTSQPIDLSSFNKGLYLLQISIGNKIYQKKIILE
ncbi:T9SS type A sorting domain-containing protein [Xanthovirga aplysinae]|uniref:T9SS type A sorting domain-containing protein n=1 Tax=Xanthovirga aplysinae TaxID=2529853 RepID=UPI0012BD3632|nr:T9SS type A sorting domain-containing protein [Xanthovirga aplysinae]MTI33452.1 T9SS type A sorting domain-containing protein [Xanthovirga aplysinae]